MAAARGTMAVDSQRKHPMDKAPIATTADAARPPAGPRTALVAGATGLVGRELLALLLADKQYAQVHCMGRRAPPLQHPKLTTHIADLSEQGLSRLALPAITDVYITLGTTIKVAGSQAAFRAVDFDAVVAVALAGQALGAINLGVVSAMGASAASGIFYNRVKGEMEDALAALGYHHTVIARPSFIEGDRAALAQPGRPGEGLALVAMRLLKPVVPANYRSVKASQVAAALHSQVTGAGSGFQLMLSGELQSF